MDKLYIIGLDQSGHYLGKDVDKLNDFLTHSCNDEFEIKKMKIMPNNPNIRPNNVVFGCLCFSNLDKPFSLSSK